MLEFPIFTLRLDQGFLSLVLVTCWVGQFFLGGGGCSVDFRIFNNTSDLYPPDSLTLLVLTTPNCVQTLPNVSWGTKSPLVDKH